MTQKLQSHQNSQGHPPSRSCPTSLSLEADGMFVMEGDEVVAVNGTLCEGGRSEAMGGAPGKWEWNRPPSEPGI